MNIKEIEEFKKRVLYEDNHIIVINKNPSEIVQRDKTGDECLTDTVKEFIKYRDNKKGNVYLGLPHRIDRPTSGIVVFAKTDKALSRLSQMFKDGDISKTYLALTDSRFEKDKDTLCDYLRKDEEQNKSFKSNEGDKRAKKAVLEYEYIGSTQRYFLYKVRLYTGRHHQIRCQFSLRGVHIKGDLKYGAKRSNSDASICLHSYRVSFTHPVSGKYIDVVCYPSWSGLSSLYEKLSVSKLTEE